MDSQLDDVINLPFQWYSMLLHYKKTTGVILEWLATHTVSSENLDRETKTLEKEISQGAAGIGCL